MKDILGNDINVGSRVVTKPTDFYSTLIVGTVTHIENFEVTIRNQETKRLIKRDIGDVLWYPKHGDE